jgi:type 2 lantibiotic biosynthesis protein LanM
MSALAHSEAAPVDWLEEALSLEEQIWNHARRTPGGEVVWLHPDSLNDPAGRKVRLRSSLYDGVTGVALFLAAVEHVTGSRERREPILQALEPVRRHLAQLDDPEASPRVNLGGCTGLGGYLYGFLWIGRWLDDPSLLAEAVGIAALITPERIEADEYLDVMHGCAGAVLGLLALEGALGEASRLGTGLVDRARACGEHLLRRRVSYRGQPRAWPARGGQPLCGFAHGATGIAYALTRLFERTQDARFLGAAEEAIAFERLHYSPERGNWLLLDSPGPHFFTGWCHGAPGIALGRVGMPALAGGPEMRQETRSALQTTASCREAARDFLCCGEMGKAEVLLRACEALGDESLRAGAERIASGSISGSRSRGGRYRWFAPEDLRFAPSFFRGAAGVGYSMLRLASPGLLPCVLALEGGDARW